MKEFSLVLWMGISVGCGDADTSTFLYNLTAELHVPVFWPGPVCIFGACRGVVSFLQSGLLGVFSNLISQTPVVAVSLSISFNRSGKKQWICSIYHKLLLGMKWNEGTSNWVTSLARPICWQGIHVLFSFFFSWLLFRNQPVHHYYLLPISCSISIRVCLDIGSRSELSVVVVGFGSLVHDVGGVIISGNWWSSS